MTSSNPELSHYKGFLSLGSSCFSCFRWVLLSIRP